MSRQALQAALATEPPPAPTVETVRYAPGDCVLLIGPGALLLKRLEALAVAGLRPALLCTDEPAEPPRGLRALAGRPARVSGWMGAFRAELAGPQGPVDLAPLSWHADGHFDWVLDFGAVPVPGIPTVAPPGYYRLADDDFASFKATLLRIVQRLREGYDKPRYFRLDEALCAHRRQGVAGCQACLGVCPATAITGGKESVAIEPHLCQGCGTCALVCPSGAVRHVLPGTPRQLERLAAMLSAWRAAGGGAVGLWVVPGRHLTEPPDGWLPLAVEEVGSLGVEFWLAALGLGCCRVAVADTGLAAGTRDALATQVDWASSLLAGLGYPQAIALAGEAAALATIPALRPALPPEAVTASGDDKRAWLLAAVDRLLRHAPRTPIVLSLPAGPLGEARVAAEGCTLCATCVRLCPTGAFSLPGSLGRLAFTEEKCLQCGLCVAACPEKVIELVPRLLTDRAARHAPRVVAEAEAVACVGCGKPFTTRAMLARSRALMADHPMFQGENARLMNLCPDCRQKAMVGVPG